MKVVCWLRGDDMIIFECGNHRRMNVLVRNELIINVIYKKQVARKWKLIGVFYEIVLLTWLLSSFLDFAACWLTGRFRTAKKELMVFWLMITAGWSKYSPQCVMINEFVLIYQWAGVNLGIINYAFNIFWLTLKWQNILKVKQIIL